MKNKGVRFIKAQAACNFMLTVLTLVAAMAMSWYLCSSFLGWVGWTFTFGAIGSLIVVPLLMFVVNTVLMILVFDVTCQADIDECVKQMNESTANISPSSNGAPSKELALDVVCRGGTAGHFKDAVIHHWIDVREGTQIIRYMFDGVLHQVSPTDAACDRIILAPGIVYSKKT